MTEQEAIAHVQAMVGDQYKVWSTPRYEGCEIDVGPAKPMWKGRFLFPPALPPELLPTLGPPLFPYHYYLYGDTWEDAALRSKVTIGQYMFNKDALLPPA